MSRSAPTDVVLSGIDAITFDFGNTLVPVSRRALRAVIEATARQATERLGLGDPAPFLEAWAEERDRQFREEVPAFREVDLPQRATRVLARLRGMAAPRADERWDDEAAASLSGPREIDTIVEAYSAAFVAGIPAPPTSRELLAGLRRRGFRLAILSNWPLAATIDRFAAAAGWEPYLEAVLVSQRIGTIKPHPAIFRFAEATLATTGEHLLHVGDDWAADVVGAAAAGWRVAYLEDHQLDTSLPTSAPGGELVPDLTLDRLADLPAHLAQRNP